MNFYLNHLKEIASAVMYAAEANTLEEVLQRIAEVSRDLVHARYAALGIPDGRGGLRYFEVSGMTQEQIGRISHPPVGTGLLGVIMHERETLRLEEMQADPRAVGFPPGHPHMERLLGVPIHVGQDLFGMLYLTDPVDGKPFSAEDQTLVEIMAGYAALAIEGAQLREQQRRLTLLEERERIGMELHDGVIQSLYAIGMNLELLRLDGKFEAEDLKPSIESLNDVIEDIRAYILNLKSRGNEHKLAREFLGDIVARLHIPPQLKIEVDALDTPIPFTPALYEALRQMVNEALSNVVRHAEATRTWIIARQYEDQFQITIADNGQGFDLNKVQCGEGLGLPNVQQRARLHGGNVHIDTSPGRGTRVTIHLPIR